MNKKGFTLIELLAVIVILAIIATIATPIVLNIISDLRKDSTEISMKNIDKSASLYFQRNRKEENIVFECSEGKCKSGNDILELSGKSPDSGKIIIDKKGNITYEDIVLNGFNCYKEHNEFVCDSKKTRKTYQQSNIIINSKSEYTLFDYNIYGNSIQNETTLQYENVGEKTKNLLNIYEERINIIGKIPNDEFKVENGIVSFKTNYFVSDNNKFGLKFKVEPNTNYTFKYKTITGRCSNNIYDLNGNLIKYSNGGVGGATVTFNSGNNEYLIWQMQSNAWGLYTELTDIIITNDIDTTYEPYGYKIPIHVSSENLLDLSKASSATLRYGEYGIKQVRRAVDTNGGGKFSVNIKEGETLYLSFKFIILGGTSNGVFLRAYPTDGGDRFAIFQQWNTEEGKNYTLTYTASKDIKNVEFYTMIAWDVGSYYVIDNVKLTYEKPKQYNLFLEEPLRKLEDKVDYIDFKNQKVVRYIGEDTDGNLKILAVPKEEKIELPEVLLRKGVNNIETYTSVKPSKIELEYYK